MAKYNNCNAQFNRGTGVILITGLCSMFTVTMLVSPATGKEYLDCNQPKPIVLFKVILLVI